MEEVLSRLVRERLTAKESPHVIREALANKGYSPDDIEEALREAAPAHVDAREKEDRHNAGLFAARDVLDRVGYGMTAPQFMNILFMLSGANIFFLGLVNGLKAVVSMLSTTVLQEYGKVHKVSKNVIGGAGIIFGFSFLVMALATRAQTPWLFALGMLLAGIGVVTYGDLYHKFVHETLRREKRTALLARLSSYGLLLTMAAMLLSGWIMDSFPETAKPLVFFHSEFVPIGYLFAFEITAFTFIISGYLLHFVTERRKERTQPFGAFIKKHYAGLRRYWSDFTSHPYTLLLLLATGVTGLAELLGHSYYGWFLYKEFQHEYFGGFLNVAVIFATAILASFIGPWFTRHVRKAIGLAPTLVFGTMLTALLPFTLVFNPHLVAIAVAAACTVIGSAMVGFSQGLLARKLMGESLRQKYFLSLGFMLAVPYLLLAPLGAWLAAALGMKALFLAVTVALVVVATPLYFVLVVWTGKERL